MSEPFFKPKGVAVIGASRNPHKLGYGVVRNLDEYHYRGQIYPINRSASEILGYPCYASVTGVPDPVDLAVVIVPAPAVVNTLDECGKRGIKNAIVVSGGFSETGKDGEKREREMLEMVRKYDMRIIGPNCIGTIDTHTPVNTTFVVGMPEPGEIGFVSQSGAMVAAVIDWARGAGVGFSRIVSLGNQADINETDMIDTICRDQQTKVITAYMEGVSNGRAFMETAHKASLEKPFVILKGGKGKSGAEAVASHTGALAGSAVAYDAAFRRCGVQRADTMEEMFDWARALAWQPLPKGNRVAVLTNAGGPAILAVDALEEAGLEISPLTEHTKTYLDTRLPEAASVNNPVDVLAGSGPGTYAVALDALLTDETVDAVVVIQAPQDWFLPASLAEVVGEVAGVHRKPVITSVMGKASVDEALSILHKRKIPNVAFPERVASVLKVMLERKKWLDTADDDIEPTVDIDLDKARKAARGGRWEELLSIYGIQTPPQLQTESPEEAIRFAEKIGFPVVLKIISKEMTHKSDAGGVKLNQRSGDEIKQSFIDFKQITDSAGIELEGVLVQKMLTGGQEVIIGTRKDSQFGSLILFGSGGVDVELMKDVQTDIAPLNRTQAERMVEKTRAGVKLKGWRNLPPADSKTVIDYILRMAQLADQHPEISELEINPLYVMPEGEGAYAVDVRGVSGGK